MYRFTGFFARPQLAAPTALPRGASWRAIAKPFDGVGVLVRGMKSRPSVAEIETLAGDLGLQTADAWIYLTYGTFGGWLESVYGLVARGSNRAGPFTASRDDQLTAAYEEAMSAFGVSREDAHRFEPFSRGFWGDT